MVRLTKVWMIGIALLVRAFGVAEAQVTSEELAEVLFQERYGQGNGFVGYPTNDYLEEYSPDNQTDTGLSHHAGIDLRARDPEPVYSPVSGEVIYACYGEPSSLEDVRPLAIYVDDQSALVNGEPISGYTVIFQHLTSCAVGVGDRVQVGDEVALSGQIGTRQPHLHIEVQRGRDLYPCGEGAGDDTGCPFNRENPTPQDTIANSTYDPREVIKSIVSVRDLDDGLSLDEISERGLRFVGLNFGEGGSLLVRTDLSRDEEGAEYYNCVGSYALAWEVAAADLEWNNTEIVDNLFPHREIRCGRGFSIDPADLRMPLSFKILHANGAETNEFSFPFKDVGIADWYAPHVVRAWAKGVIEGYKKVYPREDEERNEKSENRFSPYAAVTVGEALKMIFVASGVQVPEDPSCACEGISDVHWAYSYACSGLDRGWLTCPLRPDESAKRGFVAAIIAKSQGMPDDLAINGDLFSDVPEDHQYAREITFCHGEQIFEGYRDGTFRPEDEINRAELAKTLNVGLLDGEP